MWPQGFRDVATLNKNRYKESMHRLLKYDYLNGKKVKRLDHIAGFK